MKKFKLTDISVTSFSTRTQEQQVVGGYSYNCANTFWNVCDTGDPVLCATNPVGCTVGDNCTGNCTYLC